MEPIKSEYLLSRTMGNRSAAGRGKMHQGRIDPPRGDLASHRPLDTRGETKGTEGTEEAGLTAFLSTMQELFIGVRSHYPLMTRRNERRIRLLCEGNQVLRMMSWSAESGLYLKLITKGPGLHQHLFPTDEGLGSVVTHERSGKKSLHTQRRTIPETSMMKFLSYLLATPENPPPDLSGLPKKERRDAFKRWFDEIKPKVFHSPSTRKLEVLGGPLETLIDSLWDVKDECPEVNLMDCVLEKAKGGDVVEKNAVETISENRMFKQGHRVGLTKDGSRLVFFLTEDLVMEVSNVAVDSVLKLALHEIGIDGFIRSMHRKGILPK